MKLLLISTLILAGISLVTSYKVLMIMAFASKSHRNVFDPIAEELVKNGNEVTIMSVVKTSKQVKGITEIWLKETAEMFEGSKMSFFQGTSSDKNVLLNLVQVLLDMCRATYRDPEVTKILRDPKAYNFDVVVIDAIFNEFTLALGHHIGAPNIILSPANRFGSLAWGLNIPHPLSYLPSGIDENTDRMTFLQRCKNVMAILGFHYLRHNHMFSGYDEIIKEVLPNSPTIAELENKVSFLITNTNPAISSVMPSMPYSVEIGGVNCKPAKPLPKDLEDFMASSGDAGVIYFSLGSFTKGDSMPSSMRDTVIKVFAKLPQKILWKYEQEIENLPKNIILTNWAPQQDLLAHKKIRLFISHGGGLSTSEAVYHGSPILGFPLSADQWGNMATAKERGFAEYLDWTKLTEEDFMNKIQLILTNDSYKKAAVHYSAIFKDQPQPPVERAAYWIEYVARHKGAPHLKSAAENLNFFQYFLLDVIGAILLVLTSVLLVIYVLLRKVCRYFCKAKTSKTSPKKKTN